MSDDELCSAESADSAPRASEAATAAPGRAKFFRGADWVSFWIATLIALAGYLRTLAPEVTLDMSGMLSVGAMYAGVPHPPGFPVWVGYAWGFTKLLPFSNIAWRVAVSSAVAGALTCGLIALMVSRGGRLLPEGVRGCKRLVPSQENRLRIVCGVVAGLGFGFDRSFWGLAVVVHTWPLAMCMFAFALALLMKWSYAPERRRWLYGAFFVFSLTLSSHQVLFCAALGLEMIVLCGSVELRRDFCFANVALFIAGLVANGMGWLPFLNRGETEANLLRVSFLVVGAVSAAICALLTLQTRRLLTEWKALLAIGAALLLGVMPYFYMPLAAMTTPPANWGYARITEGFVHDVTRGQYERMVPTHGVELFLAQLGLFGDFAVKGLGWPYVIAALIPLGFLHRMESPERRWLLGTLLLFLSFSTLLLVVLNPPPDQPAFGYQLNAPHLLLAVWAGYGLILLGTLVAREKTT